MSLRSRYQPFALLRPAPVGGFEVEPPPSVVGGYSGFVQPVSGGESFENLTLDEKATHRLYTDTATPIRYRDLVRQGAEEYRVLYSDQPAGISGVSHHKEILLARRGN